MEQIISNEELFTALKKYPGLIPYQFEENNQLLAWIDLENYHPYEGFFFKAVNMFASLKNRKSEFVSFLTDSRVLEDERILTDWIYPSGFIFHAGRCGSTLLTKVFARSRKNLVLGETSTHHAIFLTLAKANGQLPEDTEQNRQIFKNLILATTRRRLSSHQNCIIKFTSYNIFFYDFIRRVFPDVPAIFLFRKPTGIISSLEQKPMVWLTEKDQKWRALRTGISDEEFETLDFKSYLDKIVCNLFSEALNINDNKIGYINFEDLREENFPSILKIFNLDYEEKELNLMKSQFNYYSKSELKLVRFSKKELDELSETEEDYTMNTSSELRSLYDELCRKSEKFSRHSGSGNRKNKRAG